jgi:hypothetical protein
LNTSALNVVEGLGTQLMCAGDVMGLLGGLPLASIDGVRMGRPVAAVGHRPRVTWARWTVRAAAGSAASVRAAVAARGVAAWVEIARGTRTCRSACTD